MEYWDFFWVLEFFSKDRERGSLGFGRGNGVCGFGEVGVVSGGWIWGRFFFEFIYL